jgi:hypothetical protein
MMSNPNEAGEESSRSPAETGFAKDRTRWSWRVRPTPTCSAT